MKKILTVDDVGYSLAILSKTLESMGYNVDAYKSPAEALKKIRYGQYDLVITDMIMKEMNGIDFYESAKNMNVFSDNGQFVCPPFILVTAMAENADGILEEAMKVGFVDVILKPINRERLQKSLDCIFSNQSVFNQPSVEVANSPEIANISIDTIMEFLEEKFPGAKNRIREIANTQ